MKRTLSLLLAFMMIFTVPVFADADTDASNAAAKIEAVSDENGQGTPDAAPAGSENDENGTNGENGGENNGETTEQPKEFTTDTFENYVVDKAVATVDKMYVFDDVKDIDMYKNALKRILAKNPELLDEALKGIFNNLDPNSEYYTAEEYNAFIQSLSNELCGIGVIVTQADDKQGLLITSVIKNTPASKSGLKRYDTIIAIDDVLITGLSLNEAKPFIAGEKGSEVKITVMRNGEKLDFVMKRDTIISEVGYYQLIENDTIGYINLSRFEGHCAEFMGEAAKYFKEKGIKNVIIDLRNNPGGDLNEFVEVCQYFIPKGPVIHLVGKDGKNKTTMYSELEERYFDLAVLVNGHSASASEAFSGAVQDTKSGAIIGEKTYGKGTKQIVSRIISGGGIRLTDAEYLTAGERHIHGVGIIPDFEIANKEVKYDRKYFEEITHDKILKQGDTGSVVKAYKQRLYQLGFDVGIPNDEFDEKMFYAVMDFQYATGLYPYGELDLTTQMKIEEIISSGNIIIDKQLEKAIDIFKTREIKDYVK